MRLACTLPWLLFAFTSPAAAQVGPSSAGRPASAVELAGGYAGFVDDSTVDHGLVGGAVRWFVSPRVSVGPEVAYMIEPGGDRAAMLTGNVTLDFLGPENARPAQLTPFVVMGGGLFWARHRFGARTFASVDPSFTAGAGIRARVSSRVAVGVDLRFGWELHTRVAGLAVISLGRR